MVHSSVISVLERGQKTRGLAGQVAEIVQQEPALFQELMFGLWHVEAPIRILAADAIEKATRSDPKPLHPFKADILGLLSEARPAAVRWHLAQMLPRLKLNKKEHGHAVAAMRSYLEDRSAIVRTFALDTLARLSAKDSILRTEVATLLRSVTRTGTPAMKARARILLSEMK